MKRQILLFKALLFRNWLNILLRNWQRSWLKIVLSIVASFFLLGCDEKPDIVGDRQAIFTAAETLQLQYESEANRRSIVFPEAKTNSIWTANAGNQNDNRQVNYSARLDQVRFVVNNGLGKGVGGDTQLTNNMVIKDGTLYMVNTLGMLYALDANDITKVKWSDNSLSLGRRIIISDANIVLYGDHLYVSNGVSLIIAYEAKTGKIVWKKDLQSIFIVSPLTVDKDNIYYVTVNNVLYVANRMTGAVVFLHSEPQTLSSINRLAKIVVKDGYIVASMMNGTVLVFNSRYQLLWQHVFRLDIADSFLGDTMYYAFQDVASMPIIDGRYLYVINIYGKLSAFDIRNGSLLWSVNIASYKDAIMVDEYLYVMDINDNLFAFNKKTGAVRFSVNMREVVQKESRQLFKGSYIADRSLYFQQPWLINSNIVILSSFGGGYEVSASTGDVLNRFLIPEYVYAPIAINNGKLYFLNNYGYVYSPVYRSGNRPTANKQ